MNCEKAFVGSQTRHFACHHGVSLWYPLLWREFRCYGKLPGFRTHFGAVPHGHPCPTGAERGDLRRFDWSDPVGRYPNFDQYRHGYFWKLGCPKTIGFRIKNHRLWTLDDFEVAHGERPIISEDHSKFIATYIPIFIVYRLILRTLMLPFFRCLKSTCFAISGA